MGAKIDFRISQVQFFPDVISMGSNRINRCIEHIGNVLCVLSLRDQINNLNFLRCEFPV